MAGSTTNINIQMDSDLKAQADALFGELGMDLSTAFNILFRRCPQDAIHILLDNAILLHLAFGIIVLPLQLVFLLNQLPLCRKQRGLQKIRP